MGPDPLASGTLVWFNAPSLNRAGGSTLRSSLVAAASLALIGLSQPSMAASVSPGFDLFVTLPGAAADLTVFGLGVVPVEGLPLPGAPFGADTVVSRLDPGPPAGSSGVIDIELVALQLTSIAPVDLTPLGGPFIGVFGDLYITVDASDRFFTAGLPVPDGTGLGPSLFNLPVPDALLPSIGQMRINHDGPGGHTGGTFSSCFGEPADEIIGNCQDPSQSLLGVVNGGVFGDAIMVIVGGDPTNPLDVLFSLAVPQISLGGIGTFEHRMGTATFPSGDFGVTAITHTGPHPVEPVGPPPPNPVPALGILGSLAAGAGILVAGRRALARRAVS